MNQKTFGRVGLRSRGVSAALSLGVLAVCIGCGTGGYEQRLTSRVGKMQQDSKFLDLYAPQAIAGSPFSVRVPQMFKDPPLVENAAGRDGKPVDPRRVKPGLAAMPGLKLTYESMVADPQAGKLPFYCYVGAIDLPGQNPSAALKAELAGKFALAADWSDFQAGSPEGKQVAWKKIRFTGQQDFCTLDKNNQEKYEKLPGILEVYLHEAGGKYLVIGWRMPANIEGQIDLNKWASLVAGCVTSKP